MLRRGLLSAPLRHVRRHPRPRLLSSGPSPSASPSPSSTSSSLPVAAPPPPRHHLAPHHGAPRRISPLLAISALSLATAAGTVYLTTDNIEETLERSRASAARVAEQMRHTWTAGGVLCKSLMSVLSSANHEVRSGFELRVAALLADITAASAARRAAIVSAGGGAVVDWLLESIVCGATQAEQEIPRLLRRGYGERARVDDDVTPPRPSTWFSGVYETEPRLPRLAKPRGGSRLMASKVTTSSPDQGERDVEIHASSPAPDDCEATRPLLTAACEAYSVSAAILPFFFPALGGLLYGYDIGATSGATIWLKSSASSGTTWYDLSSLQTGLVVSGSLYGALIGSATAFTIADFLGRRRELVVASVSYLIGALLTAAAPNFLIMVVGRFLYGIRIGLAMHTAPMYIAETAPSQIRGMLISLKEFFIVLGMLLGYIVGNLYVEVLSGWRYMYAASTPICVIMGIGMCWLPASPRWLLLCATQGKGNLRETKDNATRCLCRLRGQASPDLVSEQINLILDELSYVGEDKKAGFSEIFQGKCLKAMIIGCGLVFFQQVTGQPSVLYYAATIFQDLCLHCVPRRRKPRSSVP